MLKRLLLSLLIPLATLSAVAREFQYTYKGKTITYTVIDDAAKTCQTKAGYYDSDQNLIYTGNYSISGEIEIPAIVNDGQSDYVVVRIGECGFSFTKITSMILPATILSIDSRAFYKCSELTSVNIPNSVTEIGEYAFASCSAMTEVTIPRSVTRICGQAFGSCDALNAVYISDLEAWCKIDFLSTSWEYNNICQANPLHKAQHLFLNGTEIKDLVIPETITSIKAYTFLGCTALKSVTIPKSIKEFGDYAFYRCSDLTAVYISDLEAWCNIKTASDSSTPLGYAKHLFLNGKELTDLVIPDTVTSIGDWAFYRCSGLTSVSIPNSVISIGVSAFGQCSSLTSVTIGNSVTVIDNYAFDYCIELTSVTIPNSVTEIGKGAFFRCDALTAITIPNSVTTIGYGAFSACDALLSIMTDGDNKYFTSIAGVLFSKDVSALLCFPAGRKGHYSIPNTVTIICDYAFNSSKHLSSVSIPNSVVEIGELAFINCYNLSSLLLPNSLQTIGYCAFATCTEISSVIIPNSVTFLGDCAFNYCTRLSDITISSSLTHIGSGTFQLTGLNSITIPNSVIEIGEFAFAACEKLESVFIPNSVKVIQSSAFGSCSTLTAITIPNSVTEIGFWAFSGCGGLTSITYLAENPIESNSNIFSDETYEKATLNYLESAADKIDSTTPWHKFVNRVGRSADFVDAGIEEISGSSSEITEVYNLSGVKVGASLEGLPKGVYIVRQGAKTTKVAI